MDGAAGANQGFGKSLSTVTSLLGAFGIALSARSVVQFAQSSIEASMAAETWGVTLDAMTHSAETSAASIEAVQRATHGTISELEAAQVAGRVYSLGLADSVGELESFTYAAVTLGKAFRGLSAEESVGLFQRMISNRSVRLLDDFGIGITQINARMKELGSTSQEAFSQAAMEIAVEKANELGGIWETQRTGVDALAASMTNLKVAIGDVLTTGTKPLIEDLATIIGYTAQIDSKGAAADQQELADSFLYSTLGILNLTNAISNAADTIERKLAPAQAASMRAAAMNAAMMDRYGTSLQGAWSQEDELTRAQGYYTRSAQGQLAAVRNQNAAIEEAAQRQENYNKALEEAARVSAEAHKQTMAVLDVTTDIAGAFGYLGSVVAVQTNRALSDQSAQLQYYRDNAESAGNRLEELTWKQDAFAQAGMDLSEQIVAARTELAGYTDAANQLESSLGGVERRFVTISELSPEDMMRVGEALKDVLGALGQEELFGTAQAQKFGLVSDEAVKQQQAIQALSSAYESGEISSSAYMSLLEGALMGTIPDYEAAQARITQTTQDAVPAYEEAAGTFQMTGFALDEMAGAVDRAGEAEDNVVSQTDAVQGAMDSRIKAFDSSAGAAMRYAVAVERAKAAESGLTGMSTSGGGGGYNVENHNATGTKFFGGGLTWLNEQGPELVTLPRGTQITSAGETARQMSAGEPVIIPVQVFLDGHVIYQTVVNEDMAMPTRLHQRQ